MAQIRSDFVLALNQICAERGIEPEVVLDSIRQAMLAAFRRDQNIPEEDLDQYQVDINDQTGAIKILKGKQDVTPMGFGRIAAQVAKQVIMQRVREAEKEAIIEEYSQKIGTMVTGMVLRFEGPNIAVDIGRGFGLMPPKEQIPNEYYRLNQRIAVYIQEIRETYRGKVIIVSRSHPQLVVELFKREVPELSSGAVEVVAVAREAGHRTKMAVKSVQDGVDPVGSCVGQKGIRVQAVINELNGEKIDIIEYSDNPVDYIKAALAPAEGLEVIVNQTKKQATITVPEDQLSLAIGKGGQNARLAAKLTGYKIDIKGDKAKQPALSTAGDEQFEIDELGLSTKIRNTLLENQVTTVSELQAKLDELKSELLELDDRALTDIEKAITRYQKRQRQLQEEQEKLARFKALQAERQQEQSTTK